jgi:hypothetical protein
MSDYDRSTTSHTLGSLPEPIRTAIRDKAESLQLTVADDAPAYLTHSVRRKKRLFGGDPDKEHDTALVIGAKDILVATHGSKRGTAVLHTRLDDADVGSLPAVGSISPDDGMSVNGFHTSGPDGGARGSYYVGLGAPDGPRAREALTEAIRAAKA